MELAELIKTVRPYTMASEERLQWKAEIAQQIIRENIPGDFVECGVWNGGAAAIQAHYAIPYGRDMHLFDSWQGMPQPSSKDVPSVGGVTPESEIGKCVGALDKLAEVMAAVGVKTNTPNGGRTLEAAGRVVLHKGWFHETFPAGQQIIGQIAMLNLDSDWWASEKLCWQTWYSKVSLGGFVYVDDYLYWPGARRAADEFFQEIGIESKFKFVGHSAWHQKQN